MPEPKLMANLVAHDSAGAHEEILLGVGIGDAIPSWVKAPEREAANTLREACPAEAEAPLGARVKVLHRDAEAGVGVSWTMIGESAQDSVLPAAPVLLSIVGLARFYLIIKEVAWRLARRSRVCGLTGERLSTSHDLDLLDAREERACILLVCR